MDIQEAHDAVIAAQADLDNLRVEYGLALADGKASAALRTKVTKAEAALEDARIAQKAIQAAAVRAEQREAEEAETQRLADKAATWRQAETDYNDLLATVSAMDRNLKTLKDLQDRFESQATAYVQTYGNGFGMDGKARSTLSPATLCRQMVQLFKTDCGRGLRQTLDKLVTFGKPGRPLVKEMPTFAALFPGRVKAEEKEAA